MLILIFILTVYFQCCTRWVINTIEHWMYVICFHLTGKEGWTFVVIDLSM